MTGIGPRSRVATAGDIADGQRIQQGEYIRSIGASDTVTEPINETLLVVARYVGVGVGSCI
jgi:hypothetical protein